MKKTYYNFYGWAFDHKPSDFEKGSWFLISIIFFPLWIWFYLLYLIIVNIGKNINKVEKIEYEEEEETYY